MPPLGTLGDDLSAAWTGGQYSLTRGLTGAYLFVVFAGILAIGSPPAVGLSDGGAPTLGLPPTLAIVAGMVGAVALATGQTARAAIVVILVALLGLATETPLISGTWATAAGLALLLHASVPPAPYGSWVARARVDPRGGWRMPAATVAAAWILLWALPTVSPLGLPPWAGAGLGLATLLMPGLARLRGVVWLGLLLFLAADVATTRHVAAPDISALLLLVALDPRWIPARLPAQRDQLFYDGTCGLCHGSVRFLLAEDLSGAAFTFGALQGETWESTVPEAQRRAVPDSVAVRTEDGRLLTRSAGVIHMLERLGGLWRVVAVAMRVVPRLLRDGAYDAVARVRYRIFGRRNALCPLLPSDLRSRFLG